MKCTKCSRETVCICIPSYYPPWECWYCKKCNIIIEMKGEGDEPRIFVAKYYNDLGKKYRTNFGRRASVMLGGKGVVLDN